MTHKDFEWLSLDVFLNFLHPLMGDGPGGDDQRGPTRHGGLQKTEEATAVSLPSQYSHSAVKATTGQPTLFPEEYMKLVSRTH